MPLGRDDQQHNESLVSMSTHDKTSFVRRCHAVVEQNRQLVQAKYQQLLIDSVAYSYNKVAEIHEITSVYVT